MSETQSNCAKCGALMARGHVPDYSRGDVIAYQFVWSPGDPEPRTRRFQTGIAHPDTQVPLTAYRCTACGFVEFRARPADAEASHG